MRKPRILEPDARYHVTARANHREMLLEPSEAKELFLATVARAKKKFLFEVENFTILGNHFHLLVHVPQGSSLSLIMKWILGVFAMAWNRIHGNWGHFWGERFFSRVVRTAEDYLQTFRYIDENPQRANLVKGTETWPFSGKAHHQQGQTWLIDPLPLWIRDRVWRRDTVSG